ncbi:MAG: N-acetylmuramoyl-L-alanine amidase [Bacteroidales bacterium]|nr:N-acetylmuramoyl-L-alanine amidase [Candidatus Cacconaster merdequi]
MIYLILVAAVLLLSGISVSAQNATDLLLKTVVIDAGHGGHDPGTVSSDRKIHESDINLDVALSLGSLINEAYPDVKVIYTRKTDTFIPLAERADIANRSHADLFISIHVNSMARGHSDIDGSETYVMGTDKSESNMEVCRRENSVIRLEEDYSTTYQGFDPDNAESYIFFNLMQNANFEQSIAMASFVQQNMKNGPVKKSRGIKQAPLMVLWRTTMPSVLVEIGYLSNPSDRKVLTDKACRKEIAEALYKAFCSFKAQYDAHVSYSADGSVSSGAGGARASASSGTSSSAASAVQSPAADGKFYRIQIFATSKELRKGAPELKGIKDYDCVKSNGMYKYAVGKYSSKEEAQKDLAGFRNRFSGAFIVFY